MTIERQTETSLAEVLERVLDKGIVVDVWLRVSVIGIDLMTVEAHFVVSSLETYLKYFSPLPSVPDPGPPPPGAARPLDVVRQAVAAWNGRDLGRYTAYLGHDYVGETHPVPTPIRGRQGARRAVRRCFRAFPDARLEIEALTAARNSVLVSWRVTGTHRPSSTALPLRRRFEVSGCTVCTLSGAKIARTWSYLDSDAILRRMRMTAARGRLGPQADHRVAAAP